MQQTAVSVLFARRDSIYKTLSVDVYDDIRDARTFAGQGPVICHPPCAQWSRLRGLAHNEPLSRSHAPWSIDIIRKNGGVLEHPEHSLLWKELSLPYPGSTDLHGGFTLSINQSWFGHPCRKRTFLYICGTSPQLLPAYPLSFDAIEYTITHPAQNRPNHFGKKPVSKSAREHTPLAFAQWLISVALLTRSRL